MKTQEQKALELALDFVEDVYLGEWRGPTERQEEVITAIKKALVVDNQQLTTEAQQSNEQGCKHCNHPLYCGTKCKNCGKQSNEQLERIQNLERVQQRKPLPQGEWPKHPSGYVGDVYMGYGKSDLDKYAMQVLAAHGITKE